MKSFKKILLWFFLTLFFLIIAAWIIIQTPACQQWIGRMVTNKLSKELKTKVSIKHIDFSLFNRMHLKGFLAEDHAGDTILYAGDLSVQITDWFFIKKNIELKYIGIENAVIKVQRSDSVWRHQFLNDYFSSTSSGSGKGGIELNLKKVEFKKVLISEKDAWMGKDLLILIETLNLDAKETNFSKKIIEINNLSVTEPEVTFFNYSGLKPRIEKNPAETIKDSLLRWNRAGWLLQLDKLQISKGIFRNKKESTNPVLSTFDGQHIVFTNIDGDFADLRWFGDTITAQMDLKANERSGFKIKKLFANARLTPQSMTFNNLDLRTNNSIIKDNFMMSYDQFDDMSDYIHKIRMAGNFIESEIDSDDIAYFAPGLKSWKKKISLQGRIRGTVADLAGRDLVIKAGNHTLLNGDISLTGLPDIEQTFINFTTNDFRTTYSDAVAIFPSLGRIKSPDLKKIQTLHFNGSFTGFINDFVTFGSIRTNLGTVKTDLNMKLPSGQQPVYSGNISTTEFRLGEFLNEPQLGSISLDGVVKGTGFTKESRNTNLVGNIHFIDYNKYRYTDVVVNGQLDKLLFDGKASINDPNVEFTLNGLFDLNPGSSAFDVSVNVKKAHFQKIGLTEKDYSLKGLFKLNFTGSNIDEFIGKARVTDASLNIGDQRLPFDSLILISRMLNGEKNLTVLSNEFDGSITGNYNIKNLPDAFRLFLNKYYPAYIKSPSLFPAQQSFAFDFNTRNVGEYMKLIHKDMTGFDYSHIYGKLDLDKNKLEIDAEVPNFSYRQFDFSDTKITGRGTLENFLLNGKAGNIIINDSITLPQSNFSIAAANDISKVNISTVANQPINKANINAIVQTYHDGVTIKVDTSSFSLNGKPWIIDKDGSLNFRRDSVATSLLVMRSGEQEIRFQTESSKIGNWNDLIVSLNKVNVGDFSPIFLPKNRLEGLASGIIKVDDPLNKFNVTSDIRAEQLLLDNDSLGSVTAHLDYDNAKGLLTGKGKNLDPEHNIDFDISLFLKDKKKAKDNRITVKTANYPINILERFLGDLFSDVQGFITGPLDMTGPFAELNFAGKVKLKEGGLKVKFTQCYYKIQDTELDLSPNNINLNGIVLTDPVSGNPVYLTGRIQHQAYSNMFFDVTASTRKPYTTDPFQNKPVLLINTTAKDNSQFYGRAIGTGLFSLTGPESEIFMKIDAIASNKDSSYITIPSSSSKESGIADFLVERKYGREMSNPGATKNIANIIYDVDVAVNPAVNLKVILDEITNDEIKGRGEGRLSIHAGSSEPLQMRGRFNILDGSYLYTFQSLFKRPFELRKGSNNYIEWIGDPYDATIRFDAVYTAEKVSFDPLVSALNLDQSLKRYREDVYVVAKLSGKLFSPDFEFNLEFPPNSKAKNDPSLNFNIQQLEKNPNQINRQVTFLIVFNSFAPPETGSANNTEIGSAISEFAYSTISSISGLIFNQVNKELNKALGKIFKTDNVSINFSGSVYNRNLLEQQGKNSFNINQGNLDINVPVSFFKDRFIIILGSTLDVPLQSTIEQEIRFLPDVSAELLINQSGTLRFTFFYRQDLDILASNSSGASRTKRSGASFSYRKEFDTIRELFSRKKNKNQKLEEPETTIENQ